MQTAEVQRLSRDWKKRRNEKMRYLRLSGMRDAEIGRQMNLTRARVGQILGASGRGPGRLTQEDVDEIRILLREGYSAVEIAPKWGVTAKHINRIERGERWA